LSKVIPGRITRFSGPLPKRTYWNLPRKPLI
jgi:hypothetical protein